MAQRAEIVIRVYSNRFLGTAVKGRELLNLLDTLDKGLWTPQKWNTAEPIRYPYIPDVREQVLAAWAQPRPPGSPEVINSLLFRRSKPRLLLEAQAWRSTRPRMNSLWAHFEALPFGGRNGPERVRQVVLAFVSWSDAVHATAFHSAQAHARPGPGTPLECLARVDWLTYWGPQYVDLIGLEQLLNAPCYSAGAAGRGVLMQAAPRFDSPELIDSDKSLIALEQRLGTELFRNSDDLHRPCRVPAFDMSETICEDASRGAESRSRTRLHAIVEDSSVSMTALAAEAETVAARRGITLDYSPASIPLVDKMLEDVRKNAVGRTGATKAANARLAAIFGAYVGEVLRRARGGRWAAQRPQGEDIRSIGLHCGNLTVYPIDRTYRRLTRGGAESLELYTAAILRSDA